MFAGVVDFEGRPADSSLEGRLMAIIAKRQQQPAVRRFPHGIIVGGEAPDLDDTAFASLSRLENARDVAAGLGLGTGASESHCIKASFEKRGDAGISLLQGDFVFVHWDAQRRALTLARDLFGKAFALFYHRGNGFVAFATHLSDLLAIPGVPRELDERVMANFLALNHCEVEATPYRGIFRVPSRGVTRFTATRKTFGRYWSPNFDAPAPYRRVEDYILRARELFDRAVAQSVSDVSRVAIRLSGGFDSSAVAATIMRQGGVEVSGFTGVPPSELGRAARPGCYLDETQKIDALAALYPGLRTNFVTPRGAHRSQAEPARGFAEFPFARRNVANLGWFSQIDHAIQAQGHDLILHGSLGNMTLSWRGDYSLAELLGQGRLLALLREARIIAQKSHLGLPRILIRDAIMPMLPPPTRRAIRCLFGRKSSIVAQFALINPDIMEDLNLRAQWQTDGFDPDYRKRETSARIRAHAIFDGLQLSRDMSAMNQPTRGVRYRDPYANRELIEFCLSVPDTIYRRSGISRWFVRQVFVDRLPREILEETRVGEQAPNWFESLSQRRPMMLAEMAGIESSSFARQLLDIQRMNDLLLDWPADASAAETRASAFRLGLDRAFHTGQFIRWFESGNG